MAPRNPALYEALKLVFKMQVRISDRGSPMRWHVGRDKKTSKPCIEVTQGGEQYEVNCPFCGDRRHRLCIGHAYLTQPHPSLPAVTHNLKCYNEQCREVYGTEFQLRLAQAGATDGKAALFKAFDAAAAPEPVAIEMRLPNGMVPLHELPADHRARQFVLRKYRDIDPDLLGRRYGASYCAEADGLYPMAKDRIIFPVYDAEGELAGWQGRAVGAHPAKWMMPPGFKKVLYNASRVDQVQVPILCEGITTSVAAGPSALAMFGKSLDVLRIKELVNKWPTAILLLDADAHVPDPKTGRCAATTLTEQLNEAFLELNKLPIHLFRWDEPIMALARRRVLGKEKIEVPDPADMGPDVMRYLLDRQVPGTHRGLL